MGYHMKILSVEKARQRVDHNDRGIYMVDTVPFAVHPLPIFNKENRLGMF